MPVCVLEGIRVCSVIDFGRMESLINGLGYPSGVKHKLHPLFLRDVVLLVHVILVCYHAAARMGLFLEEIYGRNFEVGNLDHQFVKLGLVLAIKTILWHNMLGLMLLQI